MRRFCTKAMATAAVCGLVGCGPIDSPTDLSKVVEVKGKVRLADGKAPPAGATMVFARVPGRGENGLQGDGMLKPDGNFAATVGGKPGVPAGKYKVFFECESDASKKAIPTKYQSGASTDIEIDVAESTTDLKVQLKG